MSSRNSNTLRVLQLWGSACFQQFKGYQRRIPIHREPVRYVAIAFLSFHKRKNI